MERVPKYGYDGYLSVDMFSGATETTKNLQLQACVAEYEWMDMIWRTDIGYKTGDDDWILNYVDDNY